MGASEDEMPGEDRQSHAFRAAQLSGSNIYWFRRLKWQMPRRLRSGLPVLSRGPRFKVGIVELLLVGVILASFGYVAATLYSLR